MLVSTSEKPLTEVVSDSGTNLWGKLKMKKTAIPTLLAICLLLLAMPVFVFAENEQTPQTGAVETARNSDGACLTTMPASKAAVMATLEKTSSSFPFTDVPENYWGHSAIVWAYENGIFTGTSGTTFSPELGTTRGMIATILWRLENKPVVNYAMTFKDVSSNAYYCEAVRWAASSGVVFGYDANTFAPDQNISREQLATILWRYAKYKGYDVSIGEETNILSYDDALNISEYAYPPLQWACGAGLMEGDANKLMPQGGATRAQAATILQRFVSNVKK